MFILDSSGSINKDLDLEDPRNKESNNWTKVVSFVQSVIELLPIGPNACQVGLINYGNRAKVEFQLDEYYSRSELKYAVASVPWKDQKTNTSGALWKMSYDVFTHEHGDREDAANIALLITDGESNLDEDLVPQYSDIAKQTAEMFVIGVSMQADDQVK